MSAGCGRHQCRSASPEIPTGSGKTSGGPISLIPTETTAIISITCPHCGRVGTLKTAVASGFRVRCPGCQQRFEVQAEGAQWESVSDLGETDESPSTADGGSSLPDPSMDAVLEEVELAERSPTVTAPVAQAPMPATEDRIWEYKILTQKDKWFSGKFDPEKLEQALNAYAQQGWRVRGVPTASIPGFGGNRDELIFVLER